MLSLALPCWHGIRGWRWWSLLDLLTVVDIAVVLFLEAPESGLEAPKKCMNESLRNVELPVLPLGRQLVDLRRLAGDHRVTTCRCKFIGRRLVGHNHQRGRGALCDMVVFGTSPTAQAGSRNLYGGNQVAEDGEENDQFAAAGGA